MSDSTKDRIEGTLDELQGEGKERLGRATGDEQTQAEGALDQAQGEGKQGMADLKDKAGDLLKKATDGN